VPARPAVALRPILALAIVALWGSRVRPGATRPGGELMRRLCPQGPFRTRNALSRQQSGSGGSGDPEIKIGHLNRRTYSGRPRHLEFAVRWLIFAAWIAGLDAAAINWTIMAREIDPRAATGGGSLTAHWRVHHRPDGSVVRVVRNGVTGNTVTTMIHPPTAVGMCLTWSPAFAGGLLTLLAVALAATRSGRRLIVEFPVPRMTTRRWMIAVAFIGVEAWLIIGAISYLLFQPRSSLWPPILIYLAALHTLTFLPACGRTRSGGAEMSSAPQG
jgi:hypothetical protein